MSDKKTLGFSIAIDGVSNEAQQLAKLEVQLKNIKRERDELQKQAQKGFASKEQLNQLAAYNAEVKRMDDQLKILKRTVDTASDSLARKKALLIELKKEYDAASESVAKKMAPGINKLTSEISKAEAAVGTHSRGVGNYKNAIKDAAKELFAFAAPAAAAAYALNGLKEAFAGTERGTNLLGRAKLQMTAFFDAIVEGRWRYAFGNELPKDIKVVADMMNKVRIDERKEIVEISAKELEIKNLRIDAVKAGKDSVEQVRLLTRAEEVQGELIKIKLAHKREELGYVNLILAKDPENTAWLNKRAQLEAEINGVLGERSLRIASKLEAAQEKILQQTEKEKEIVKKAAEEKLEIERKFLKNKEDMQKYFFDKWKSMVEEEKNIISPKEFEEDFRKLLGVKDDTLGLQQNKKTSETNKKQVKAAADYDLKQTKETEDKKKAYKLAAIQGVEMGIQAGFEAKKNRLQAEMEAELSNQNLTEVQKLAIQKKYAKEQQKMDVSQAIISGALAILSAMQTKPFIPAGLIAAAIAGISTATQIATIKAQKFARGGRITSGVHVNTGTVDDTLIVANRTETVLTQDHVRRLGGSGAMRRIGVPGYAMGGYIGSQAPEVMSSGIDLSSLARMINDKKVILEIHKLNKANAELQTILKTQPI